MRAVVQRVSKARVLVDGSVVGDINKGIAVLLGVGLEDSDKDIVYLTDKVVNLRIFEDENGKMNRSLLDIQGEILIVSQFTLFGDCRRGKRPSYDKAARPEFAQNMYNEFVERVKKEYNIKVQTGKFQTEMMLEIHNDGPVTLLLDSKKDF